VVPNAEPGYTVSEKRLNPITDFGQKALVTYDVTVLLLHKDSVRSVMIKGDLVQKGGRGRGVATQAYPKVRAKVLIRHKRLYLVCTDGTRMLFKLSRASVCKQNGKGPR